jgi:tripartite-type tricarboxylate transporter receptor subunit TctC
MKLIKIFTFTVACWFASVCFADSNMHIVVPFAAGGTADSVARLIAKQYNNQNRTAVVENRIGGGGHIGARYVAGAKPDGNTLLFATMGVHTTYSIYNNLGYDPSVAFRPVIIVAELPNVLVVNPKNSAQTLKEFVEQSKTNERPVNFGSAGIGSSTHLTGELFKLRANIPTMQHIPYKGSILALNDVLGGQIDAMFEQVPTTIQHIKTGKLRALGVTSRSRISSLPDVPTVAEQGYPNFESIGWFSISVPADTPDVVVKRLNKELNDILKDKTIRDIFAENNLTAIGGTPEFAANWFKNDSSKWRKVIDSANIRE